MMWSVVLLEDANAHVGNGGDTWRDMTGKNSFPDLNPSVKALLDFCTSHGLSSPEQFGFAANA